MKKPKTTRDTAKLILSTPDVKIQNSMVILDPVTGVMREHFLNDEATKAVGRPKELLDFPEARPFVKQIFKKKVG